MKSEFMGTGPGSKMFRKFPGVESISTSPPGGNQIDGLPPAFSYQKTAQLYQFILPVVFFFHAKHFLVFLNFDLGGWGYGAKHSLLQKILGELPA